MHRLTPRRTLLLSALILGAAVFLRLDQYFSGRSLWLDESLLALSVLDRPISRLADPLSLSQGAPFGFLAAAKLSVLSFGKSELALRLVPLLSGLAALGFFSVLARRVTSGLGVLLALALFACSGSLILYSSEFKQYSTEVAAVLALSAVAITDKRLTARRYLVVAALGAALLWFAYTTVFFLAAFACAYGLCFLLGRRWKELATVAGGSLIWLASGLAVYRISYDDLGSLDSAVERASGDSTSSSLRLLVDAGTFIANGAVGVTGGTPLQELVRLLAGALGVVGAVLLLRAKPFVGLMLGLPLAFMVGAVLIGRYPVFERTVLIGVPAAVLFVAHGTGAAAGRVRAPAGTALGLALAILFVSYPLKSAAEDIGSPAGINQGLRPLLQELERRWQPGDSLYVHYAAQYGFRYYADCDCLRPASSSQPLSLADRRTDGPSLWHGVLLSRPPGLRIGARHTPGDWPAYLSEVDELKGRERVWVLSSHSEPEEQVFMNSLLPEHLDRIGTRRAVFTEGAGRLLLYDLSGPG